MRLFSFICFFLISGFAMAQSPAGFPSPKTNAYYQVGFLRGDSGIIFPSRDTFNARFPTVIHHTNGKYYKTEGGTSPYWSLFADGNATVDTTTRFGGLKTIYKAYADSLTLATIINSLTTLTYTNTTNIASNTASINTLTTLTNTNTTNIASNTSNIASLNADTLTLIPRFALKLNISDTASMLSNYKSAIITNTAVSRSDYYRLNQLNDSSISIISYDSTRRDTLVFSGISGGSGSTQTITSGTYTPTPTPSNNCSSVSLINATYQRIGNVVTFTVNMNVTPTSSGSLNTAIQSISVPIIFSTYNTYYAIGSAQDTTTNASVAVSSTGSSNNNSVIVFQPASNNAQKVSVTFTYTGTP